MLKKTGLMGVMIVASTLALGCATSDVAMLDTRVRYPPTQHVEILVSPPDRPYKEIALIETRGAVNTPMTQLLESMRNKAMAIGADAILPTEDASEHQPPGVMYNPWLGGYQTLPGGKVPIIRAVAIKYEVKPWWE